MRWLGAGAGQVLPWVTTGEGEGRGADQSPVRNLDAARTARGGKAMTRPGSSIAESTPAVWGKSGPSLANTDRRRGGRRAGVSSETGRNSDVTRNTADRGKKATAGFVQAPRRRAAVSGPPRACPPMVNFPRPPQQFPRRVGAWLGIWKRFGGQILRSCISDRGHERRPLGLDSCASTSWRSAYILASKSKEHSSH